MNTMLEILKEVKFIFLIFLLIWLNNGMALSQTPVLYPNFPIVIGPISGPSIAIPYFGNTLAEIDSIPGLKIALHLRDGFLHVWDYQGSNLEGFPKPENSFPYGGTSVADLDGDGKNELVNITREGLLDVIDEKGNSWSNFPVWTPAQSASPPVLADLDNDGKKEIIFQEVWGKHIYVYKLDGASFPGWPKTITTTFSPGFIRGSPAVGDLDGDGWKEIVAFGHESAYVWTYTGELLEGWPKAPTDTVFTQYMDNCAPLLADLNKDGKFEIVAVRGAGNPDDWPDIATAVEVYNWKAELLPGWPRYTIYTPWSAPAVADLDKDGELEIVLYTLGYINILKSNGEFYPGWPKEVNHVFDHQPILVDVDNNDSVDIFLVRSGNYISGTEVFAYSLNGGLLAGYPFNIIGDPWLLAPAVGDVKKNDSVSALIVTEQGVGYPGEFYVYVYLYDLGVPYDPSSVQWGTYGHNNRRTNNYHDGDVCNAKPGDATGDTLVDLSDIIKIVDYLFRANSLSGPKCALDPNFDRKIKLSDVVYLINYLFKNGIPPIPYDDCCVVN